MATQCYTDFKERQSWSPRCAARSLLLLHLVKTRAGELHAVQKLAALVDAGALLPEVTQDLGDADSDSARGGWVRNCFAAAKRDPFHQFANVDAAEALVAQRGRGASASVGKVEIAPRRGGSASQILHVACRAVHRIRPLFPMHLNAFTINDSQQTSA
jgi:hypothetical protein